MRTSDSNSYDYCTLVREAEELVAQYPWIELTTIGHSVLERPLLALRIGVGAHKVHYNASFHANEWITTPLLMTFVRQYAEAVACGENLYGIDARSVYELNTLWVVPMVNPDGVELVLHGADSCESVYDQIVHWNGGSHDFNNWKANIRGVDLNDQFPAHWDVERERRDVPGPGPRDYTGEAPLTEPEAAAIAHFTQKQQFDLVMALHSQGREIYWNYRDFEPDYAESLAQCLAQASGYEAVKLTGSDAGYKDWFIQDFRRPGFTIEVGYGVNPLPIAEFSQIYEEVAPLLLQGLIT
ncbi:M14 family metallocarboxypeptidase [Paenibacillus sp. N1-5-1-14]|uniref:M14 family metallopeptidase n=1 Tax=Paenibacillus radicibacter TaxID=2972488 RepID=UPI0021598B3F|nr:M14 family metallocarboxypeptidase [Paenibacillus radicibacter]MCR8643849.1 M14 family metallocarboxypeptidase [Paenibacillus radicibacter]